MNIELARANLATAILETKHLAGQHDQKKHGKDGNNSQDPNIQRGVNPLTARRMTARQMVAKVAATINRPAEGPSPLLNTRHIMRIPTHAKVVTVRNSRGKIAEMPSYNFAYVWSDDLSSVKDKKALDYAIWLTTTKGKIPQNVTDVRINPDQYGEIQATWRDINPKQKVQTIYSTEHVMNSAQSKFERLHDFHKDFPKIMGQIEKDMYAKDVRKREAARMTYIMAKTGLRPGWNRDTGGLTKAYGVTTLLNQHVKVSARSNSEGVWFEFVGKHGLLNRQYIADKKLASIVREQKGKRTPSEELWTTARSADALEYMSSITDNKYTLKDFRTYKSTIKAMKEIAKYKKPPETEKDFLEWQERTCKLAAEGMGHNWRTARDEYIDPSVWTPWLSPAWSTGPWLPKSRRGESLVTYPNRGH